MATRPVTVDGAPPSVVCVLQMLGGFRAVCGKTEVRFKTRKTASLLAHLCTFKGRSLSKEVIAESLWPDADDERGRQSLRAAVSALRSGLSAAGVDGNRLILSDRHTLEAAPDAFWSDVDSFRSFVARTGTDADRIEALTEAIGHYGGHFLPGATEDWVMPQALELEELHAQAVVEFCGLLVAAGRAPEALAEGKRALAISPLREDLHIALMRAHAAAGQSSAAIRQYEILERLLDEQWGEAPSKEAADVIESLPAGTRPDRSGVAPGTLERAVAAVAQNEARDFVVSPVVGRDADAERILDMATEPGGAQWVTLTGIGGTGKTALARLVADRAWERLDRRVWFVELAGLSALPEAVSACVAALGIERPDPSDPVAHLRQALDVAPSLIVLDNAEHMPEDAVTLVQALRQGSSNLRIIVTSRVPLGAEGETNVPVKPLPIPSGQMTLEALRAEPAVQVLTRAAQTHRPGFAVTPDNARSVHQLCLRLQGYPLAIELAAAQLKHQSPAQVLASLGRILDLPTGRQDFDPRRRDLRAVIGWSAERLEPDEREVFRSISLVATPLSLDHAERLAGRPCGDVLDRLAELSLGEWRERGEVLGFETLEPVREFAEAWLSEDAKEADMARQRHFDLVADEVRAALARGERGRFTDGLQANVIQAIGYGTRGSVPAERVWELAHRAAPGVAPASWVEPIDALAKATADALGHYDAAWAWRTAMQAQYAVRNLPATADAVERAVSAARRSGDALLLAKVLVDRVIPASMLGDDAAALAGLAEAESLLAEAERPDLRAEVALNRAWVHFDFNRPRDALPLFEHAVAYAESAGESGLLAGCLTGLACAQAVTDPGLANVTFERSRELAQASGKASVIAHGLYYRALTEYRFGNARRAVDLVLASLQESVFAGFRLGQTALSVAGTAHALAGSPVGAVACWARADASARRSGTKIFPTNRIDTERETPGVIASLAPMELKEASEWGASLLDEEFVARLQTLRPT